MAQDYQSIPAPAGFGNQVLHELLMKEDTLIMALTGDGSYDWDGVHFSFPVNSTLIFETTLEEKYPIKSASLSSTAGKVEVFHLIEVGNTYLLTGKYLNNLSLNGEVLINNKNSSSGFFILSMDKNFQVQQVTHYEGGIVSLPRSIHLGEEHLYIPISLIGKLYQDNVEIVDTDTERLMVLAHDAESLAFANVDFIESVERFHTSDYGYRGDTLFIFGDYRGKIETLADSITNPGIYPDPVLLKYHPDVGLLHAHALPGSYPAEAEQVLVNGDEIYLAGSFMGGIKPEEETSITIGERPGLFFFKYRADEYLGAHILTSEAFLFYTAIQQLQDRFLLTFSYMEDVVYKGQELKGVAYENSFGAFELMDFSEDGKLSAFPYRGQGNFPIIRESEEYLHVLGSCNGLNTEDGAQTDEADVIHLRKLKEKNTAVHNVAVKNLLLYPQPATHSVKIKGLKDFPEVYYGLYNLAGELLQVGKYEDGIQIKQTISGYNVLVLRDKKGEILASLPCLVKRGK